MTTLDHMLLAPEEGSEAQPQEEGKFMKALFRSLVMGIKASNAVPADEGGAKASDYAYHALFPEFASKAGQAGGSVLDLINAISKHVDPDSAAASLSADDAADPSAFEGLADLVEDLLEDVDSFLQDDNGAIAQATQVADRLRQVAGAARRTAKSYKSMLSQLQDMPKPQDKFKDEIDNRRETIFVPRPYAKPFYKAPSSSFEAGEAPHPYEEEVRSFDCMSWQLAPPDASTGGATMPANVESSPDVVMVQTHEELIKMVEQIREELDGDGERAIAIDLEAHSIRSFQGLVCLMQLSTRSQDWLVDTPALRKSMGLMADLLADHTIVKVFHGAESDIKWLQRDFSLYVVNLFDTFLAAKRLQLPGLSLAFLLDKYCQVKADKAYQLADWRVRPLPPDMIRYAREDTHYLLYIFDRLRQDLHQAEGRTAITAVMDAGRDFCCLRYKKDVFDREGWQVLLSKARMDPKSLGPAEAAVLRALYDWRDQFARSSDESVLYVCSDRTLLRIAQIMPRTFDSLQECGNPLPPLVAKHAQAVLGVVSGALEAHARKQQQDQAASLAESSPTTSSAPPPSAATAAVSSPFSSAMDDDSSGHAAPLSVAGGGLSRMRASASPFTLNIAGLPAPNMGASGGGRAASSPDQLSTSPVLPTEDLYRTAGWTTPLGSYLEGGRAEDAGAGARPWGFAHDLGGMMMGGGGGGLSAMPAMRNEGLETFHPLSHSMQLGEDQEGLSDEDEGLARASRIRDEMMAGQKAGPWALGGTVEYEEGGGAARAGREEDEEDGDEQEDEGRGEEEGGGEDEEEDMPRSMADIYRISNRNRRRNKEKKKVNEPAGESLEEAEEGGAALVAEDGQPVETTTSDDPQIDAYFVGCKRKKTDPDDSVRFMAGIGWIGSKDLVPPPSNLAAMAAMNKAQGAGGGGGPPFRQHPEGHHHLLPEGGMIAGYGRQMSDGDDGSDGGLPWQAGGGRPSPNSFRRGLSGNSPPLHGQPKYLSGQQQQRNSSPSSPYQQGMPYHSSSPGHIHSPASNSPRRPGMSQQGPPPSAMPRRFVDYSNLPASVVSAMSASSPYADPSPRGPPFHMPVNAPPQPPPKYNPYLVQQQQQQPPPLPQQQPGQGGPPPMGLGMPAMGMGGAQMMMMNPKVNPNQGQSSPWRNRGDGRQGGGAGPGNMGGPGGMPPGHRWGPGR